MVPASTLYHCAKDTIDRRVLYTKHVESISVNLSRRGIPNPDAIMTRLLGAKHDTLMR